MSEDEERSLFAEALTAVDGLRDVKTQRRNRAMRFIRKRTLHCVNAGVRDKVEIQRRVQADAEDEFGSIILLAVLAALVQFIVLKILRRIWPDEPKPPEQSGPNVSLAFW